MFWDITVGSIFIVNAQQRIGTVVKLFYLDMIK